MFCSRKLTLSLSFTVPSWSLDISLSLSLSHSCSLSLSSLFFPINQPSFPKALAVTRTFEGGKKAAFTGIAEISFFSRQERHSAPEAIHILFQRLKKHNHKQHKKVAQHDRHTHTQPHRGEKSKREREMFAKELGSTVVLVFLHCILLGLLYLMKL